RLIAHQARERRALQYAMARRHSFDGGQEARREIPGSSGWPGTAAPGWVVRRRHPRITPRGLYVRRDRRPLTMMVRVQVVGRNDRQVARRGKVADHHLAPRVVVHRELAVPQPVRHRRLDLLPTGRPFDGVAGAEIDDTPLSGLVVRQLELA